MNFLTIGEIFGIMTTGIHRDLWWALVADPFLAGNTLQNATHYIETVEQTLSSHQTCFTIEPHLANDFSSSLHIRA